jgi:hypothetical protein
MDAIIKQGINNCYMVHHYEHPGYEEKMCAGLRTMNGEGEPIGKCKDCRLYYGYASEHQNYGFKEKGMAKCSKQTEDMCLCRDCAVINCERYNCRECETITHERIHEVFFCNSFREQDSSR